MFTLAPIVLFVYNRPAHTQRTLESLSRNNNANQSDLIIYSDGPKNGESIENIEGVRRVIKSAKGFRSVTIHESESNRGLADSIVLGVTAACNQYGKVIVLEDDIDVSPHFLTFMNDALSFYSSQEKVMHISACTYPINTSSLELEGNDTFFFRVPLCWGWATWDRAWRLFDRDIAIIDKFTLEDIYQFNIENSYPYFKQLEQNKNGEIKTWFVFWYATLFFNKSLSVFPVKALANNIGFDGSGVHCGTSDAYSVLLNEQQVTLNENNIVESSAVINAHKAYFRKNLFGFFMRFKRKVNKLFKN